METDQAVQKAALLRMIQEIEDDVDTLDVLKGSGLKAVQLKSYAASLDDRIRNLEEALLLENVLSIAEREYGEAVASKARRKVSGMARAFTIVFIGGRGTSGQCGALHT